MRISYKNGKADQFMLRLDHFFITPPAVDIKRLIDKKV